jgi:cytochrome P450
MTAVDQPQSSKRAAGPTLRFDELQCPHKQPPGSHFANFDRLREAGPIHFGDASGNPFWMITRMEDIRAAFQDPATFSNSAVVPDAPEPPYRWIPEMLDAPLHGKWRRLLGPLFSPGAVDALAPKVHARFGEIIDEVAPRGHCDFVADVALRFPNTIFLELMGLPVSDAAQFQAWETAILHNGSSNADGAIAAMQGVMSYFGTLVADRRVQPRDDIISKAITWQIDGEEIPDSELLAFCLLMFMAGLDTVAMQLAYSFWHLGTHPGDLQRITADPSLMPGAVEEFLRYYAFVTPGRKATSGTEVAGCPVQSGDMVFLPLAAANRDPREFDDAGKVLIDRKNNHHIAFGAGPHRCLGSHLARLELNVAMEEWHKRIPAYHVDPATPIREHGGQIGLDNLPLRWDA